MTVRKLIRALGGAAFVARRVGLGVPAVENWCIRDRLPDRHILAVWRLAKEAGVQWRPAIMEGVRLSLIADPPAPRPASVAARKLAAQPPRGLRVRKKRKKSATGAAE